MEAGVLSKFCGVIRKDCNDGSLKRFNTAFEKTYNTHLPESWIEKNQDTRHFISWCPIWEELSPEDKHSQSSIIAFDGCLVGGAKTKIRDSESGISQPGSALGRLDGLTDEIETKDGPFLIASVNADSCEAIILRDKFGLRPLYYYHEPGRLWFADDIRLLLNIAPRTTVRTIGLIEWMHYGLPLEPHTFFREIHAVKAGHKLIYDWSAESIQHIRYFDPRQYISPSSANDFGKLSVAQLEEMLEKRLDDAIALSIGNHSSVSILVSGGVDSSLVAALASKRATVNAVTVDVNGPDAESEVEYAKKVAKHLGLEHRICRFGPKEFRETVCGAVCTLGTPIIIENAVALQYAALSGDIPAGKLILDGEGGDALFCGSTDLFKYSMLTYLLSSLPGISSKRVRTLLELFRKKISKLGLSTRSTLDGWGLDSLLSARRMEMRSLYEELYSSFSHVNDLAAREIFSLTTQEFYDYLMPLMLRIDRMTCIAQSHAVLPFLDQEVFKFSLNLPIDQKIRWDWRRRKPVTKWLLKRVASKYIPSDIIYRPKGGFGIPGGSWIGPFPDKWMRDSWVCEHFEISQETLRKWLQNNPKSRNRMYLTTLEIWGRLFDRRESIEKVQQEWMLAGSCQC